LVNVWLNFVPGSGAGAIEMILRSCTNLQAKPTDGVFTVENDCITSHGFNKQFHALNKTELHNWRNHASYTDNVFTPIVPMEDMLGTEVLDYVNSQPGVKFYFGPSTDNTAEFAVFTLQKVPNYLNNLNSQDGLNWSNKELEPWETREHLSLCFLQWWIPQMKNQWKTAQDLGMICIDTLDFFTNTKNIASEIISTLGLTITNIKKFENMTTDWNLGQNKIWQDWNNYVQYKKGEKTISITGDILQEAMIQYHLREQGIELKCHGLDIFPSSQELKEYYD